MPARICKDFQPDSAREGLFFEDIKIMREAVGERAKIKAAGGIRDFKTAELMIKAGADRIGASAGIDIVKGSMN